MAHWREVRNQKRNFEDMLMNSSNHMAKKMLAALDAATLKDMVSSWHFFVAQLQGKREVKLQKLADERQMYRKEGEIEAERKERAERVYTAFLLLKFRCDNRLRILSWSREAIKQRSKNALDRAEQIRDLQLRNSGREHRLAMEQQGHVYVKRVAISRDYREAIVVLQYWFLITLEIQQQKRQEADRLAHKAKVQAQFNCFERTIERMAGLCLAQANMTLGSQFLNAWRVYAQFTSTERRSRQKADALEEQYQEDVARLIDLHKKSLKSTARKAALFRIETLRIRCLRVHLFAWHETWKMSKMNRKLDATQEHQDESMSALVNVSFKWKKEFRQRMGNWALF